jgi:TPR repeat protein
LASLQLHADNFIKSGDLSSARLLLERAAEAGDGRAALTLAGTFDPNELKTLGFYDGAADVAMARVWYERAETFGSAEARDRLQLLATASPR